MAQKELTQSEYDNLKNDLGSLSNNQAAAKHHVGKRRVAQVRRSKSYQGYLQIRRNEAKKRQENTPAKAVEGSSDLPNSAADLMVQTTDGESVPADQATPTSEGEIDQRPADEVAAAKADREARAEAERRNREYARAERMGRIFAITVVLLAVVGIAAIIWGAIYLLTR